MAGLVTGQDLINQLKGRKLPPRLLIPASMLRSGEQVFLDDVSVEDVERELSVTVTAVGQDGYELLDAICGIEVGSGPCAAPVTEDEFYVYNPGTR